MSVTTCFLSSFKRNATKCFELTRVCVAPTLSRSHINVSAPICIGLIRFFGAPIFIELIVVDFTEAFFVGDREIKRIVCVSSRIPQPSLQYFIKKTCGTLPKHKTDLFVTESAFAGSVTLMAVRDVVLLFLVSAHFWWCDFLSFLEYPT